MDQGRDIAILQAQLADAQADTRLWLANAESDEERVYVRRMQERLGDLERILDRVELRGWCGQENRWNENVKDFLRAFRAATESRGGVVGGRLSRLAAHFGPMDVPPRKEEKKPLAWHEIEIAFLSDERVEIISGNDRQTYNFSELGFEDRRNGTQNSAWTMLLKLAETHGEMQQPPPGSRCATIQKRLEEIREALRNHFGIDGDPIPFNGTYKASFKIGRRPSFET